MKFVVDIPEDRVERLLSAQLAGDPRLEDALTPPGAKGRKTGRRLPGSGSNSAAAVADPIERICNRFHLCTRCLGERYGGRSALTMDDEYDVQYLLNAMLVLHFDDIRPEEWMPSYAGGASRADFLLKPEKTVIEVKKTRKGLGATEVGLQLIVDIAQYAGHPSCKRLICFVYDPEGRIKNPRGLEHDLDGDHEGLEVKVIIAPKGL